MRRREGIFTADQQADTGVHPNQPGLGVSTSDDAPGLPYYLMRHYWWAYVWPPAVWFFDHQPIINLIVFGQYRKLVSNTLAALTPKGRGRNLLIASAYGCVVPSLADRLRGESLTVIDVAPIQLERATKKLGEARLQADTIRLERMNAENLVYCDGSYDRALMFLLLHELPDDARRRTVEEAIRVLRPGGELVMAEYGETTPTHPFHRFAVFRWILGTAEPYLPSFWRQNLDRLVGECALRSGKTAICESRSPIFGGFYRVVRYRIDAV